MSGQLFWSNDGAAVSFEWSPVNTKEVVPADPPVVIELELELPAEGDERNRLHGTATNLSPLLLAEVAEALAVPGVVEELALALNEITAKSILPEDGLRMTSLTVPIVSPELPLISEPANLLARTSLWLLRPVALRRPYRLLDDTCDPWLELLEGSLLEAELPGVELLDGVDGDCACAPRATHAAQSATVVISCFLINCLSSCVLILKISTSRCHLLLRFLE
jgi:hypothetical protein